MSKKLILIFSVCLIAATVLCLLFYGADSSQPSDTTAGTTAQTTPTPVSSDPAPTEPSDPTQPAVDPTEPPTDPTEPSSAPTEPPETQTQPTQTEPSESQTQPPETQPSETQPKATETQPTEPLPTLPPDTSPVDPQPDNAAGEKIIYLTFDDGPGKYTPQLLEILEKYNVKATFFVVGSAKLEYLDDIAQAGHAIGIHTDTHRLNEIYASTDAFWKDFYAIEDKIFQHTGIHTKLHRFPGGSSNSASKKYCKGIMSKLVKEVEENGYHYFDWNVDSNDAGGATTAGEVYHNVITAVEKKTVSVVLMHDVKAFTVEAVESILRWGLENGYVFKPLDETSPGAHHTVRN